MEIAGRENPQRVSLPPPPLRFKAAGIVEWADLALSPPTFASAGAKRRTGRRAQGANYERKIQRRLLDSFSESYVDSPWFTFRSAGDNAIRWCQPDGLLFQPLDSLLTVIEIKLQHTSDAWWQTQQLYLPVIAQVFPPALWRYNICEIVKWFDPHTNFPWKFKMCEHPLMLAPNTFGVHICKP